MATVTIKVDGIVQEYENVDLDYGVRISDIGEEEEWDLTGIDDEPSTTITAFIGGRPKNR